MTAATVDMVQWSVRQCANTLGNRRTMRLHKIFLAVALGSSLFGCDSGSEELANERDQEKASTVAASSPSTVTSFDNLDLTASTPNANAGIALIHWLAGLPIDGQIANSRYDVVAAVVEKVADEHCTNANPPVVTLDVREVLRGDTKANHRRGIWAPFPHDVDYGTLEDNPIYQNWAKKPLAGPEPGARMILLGQFLEEDGHKSFWISPIGRFELSKENRELAMAGIKRGEQLRREREEKLALEKQLYEKKMKAWRAESTSAEIEQFTIAADFIGIGTVSSGPGIHGNMDVHDYDFRVSKILKGKQQREYADGSYSVRIWVPEDISELLYARDRAYVLFLSEKELHHGVSVCTYKTIETGDGMVEADEEALEAVTAALKRHSPPQ